MLNKIKELADEAVKLQNKNRMDEVLREISAMCERSLKEISPVIVRTGDVAMKTEKIIKSAKGVKADE